jgi:hypothetical protein
MSTGGKPIAAALRGQIRTFSADQAFLAGLCRPESHGPSSGPDEADPCHRDARSRPDGQPLLVAINIAPIRLVMVTGPLRTSLLSD